MAKKKTAPKASARKPTVAKAAAKATSKPTADEASQRRESILFAAVANFCSKRVVRSLLLPGDEYAVKSKVTGTVFGAKVAANIDGLLCVGHETTYQKSTAVSPDRAVAVLLSHIPKTRRVELLKRLVTEYAREGELPIDDQMLAEARVWLESLRSMKSAKRAGAVSFTVGG